MFSFSTWLYDPVSARSIKPDSLARFPAPYYPKATELRYFRHFTSRRLCIFDVYTGIEPATISLEGRSSTNLS